MPKNSFFDITGAAIMQKECVTAYCFGQTNAPKGSSAPFATQGSMLAITDGPIILPEGSLQGRPGKGEVLDVGPGRYDTGIFIKPSVGPGDIVLYPSEAGLEMMVGNEKCLIMREFEIYAVDVPEKQEEKGV